MRFRIACATVAAAATVVTTLGQIPPSVAAPPAPDGQLSTNATRAVVSYQALQRYLAVNDGSGLYNERYPSATGDNPYSYEWPFSQVHVATLDLTGMPGRQGARFRADLADRAAAQERYWSTSGTTGVPGYASYPTPPYGTGGDLFYDDNEWVGLLDVQQYLMSGDRAALAHAEQLFTLVRTGWDTDTSHAAPGGVFWTQATWSTDRNTCSTMPGAQLGLRLYQITGRQSYLDWALRMYAWTNKYLLSPDGLYWDHLDLSGTVEKTHWSYNQGVPIGVNALLYEITRNPTYLRRAEHIARTAYDYYVTQGRLSGQPPFFNAIFFKNLLLLESITGGHTYRDAMTRYAADAWTQHRNPATGLFTFDNSGATEAIQQGAMTQIYAVLAWNPAQYRLLY